MLGRPLYRFDRVSSTMDVLSHLAAAGAPEGTTVVAGFQESGRGRADRRWVAPPDRALLASVLLRPDVPLHRLPPLSMLVADAIREAVHSLYALDARVKWPNDVLVDGRKLSGVLIQTRQGSARVARPTSQRPVISGIPPIIPSTPPVTSSEVEGSGGQADSRVEQSKDPSTPFGGSAASQVRKDGEGSVDPKAPSLIAVVGFGINANVAGHDLPPTGTSILVETGQQADRGELLRVVLDAVEARYRDLADDRLESRWADIQSHLAMRGERVIVEDAGRAIAGRLVRIDRDGALVLNDGGRDHRVVAGDLSRGPRSIEDRAANSGKPGILP